MKRTDWQGKRVVVIGAARQGQALARYLALHGAQVVINDRRPAAELQAAVNSLADLPSDRVTWVFGGHPASVLDGADLVCPSGGVPLALPLVQEAVSRGIPLSNDSQIFLEAAPCRVVGITGSAGKTTTTTLVGRMAQAAERMGQEETRKAHGFLPARAWTGGNIGNPLIAWVDEMQADDLAVIELSSFQLEIMTRSPQVAAILNITPNHLDRHASMDEYTAAKANILAFQSPSDIAVLGRDDPGAWGLAGTVKGQLVSFGLSSLPAGTDGTWVEDGQVNLRRNPRQIGRSVALMPTGMVGLRGEHNLRNVLAACAIAAAAGLPAEAMRSGVDGFMGVPHRLEFVREWKGASWYNDSIATAPERTLAALRSFEEPVVLLAGGRDKNLPWNEFAGLALQRVDHLVLFGEAAGKIRQAVEAAQAQNLAGTCSIQQVSGLKQAVQAAAEVVKPGSVVLLSPGGTSFDEFRDFEERGEAYRKWVMELP